MALLAAGAGVCLGATRPTVPANPAQYRERREALRSKLRGGITVLFGRTEKESEDIRTPFVQEPNFYYLTGWLEPGAVLVLAPLPERRDTPDYAALAALPREILFLPRRDPDQERWTGPKIGPADPDVQKVTGFDKVEPAGRLESELRALLEYYPRIYTLAGQPGAVRLQGLAPMREVSDASLELAHLRMKKSPAELALIDRSIEATIAAHRAAWERIQSGLFEYQLAATMVGVYMDRGCERSAYPPIIGAGPDSVILHYSRDSRRMDAGEVVVMDVGAECAGYAADITRTVPVSGRFSKRQREIYDIVLGAQKAVIAAVRPGMMIRKNSPHSLYQVAYDYINTHGRDLHGEPLGKYFIHGISHHIGLEVHDASDLTMPLEEGMVISVEPGIYIPEENIGIRIEDMVLVTAHGARLLSGALPREAGEIEKAISR